MASLPNSLSQAANAQLGIGLPLMYGYCRVRGDNILLNQLPSKNRVAFYILGEGEWDGIERLWINKALVNIADTTLVHFHPGQDGTLGAGLAPSSNGGDQAVDNFFSSIPANFQRLTYSRKAYLAVNSPPDPRAPDANLDVLGDYRCSKLRIFDANGNQTAYQFSTNGAWQVLDLILRKILNPEWTTAAAAAAGGDLSAAQKARINFPAVVSAAAWCDAVLSNGQKRFESSIAFVQTVKLNQALTQLLTMSQLYVTEEAGQIFILPDQPRASTFLMTMDHVVAGTASFDKVDLHGAASRIVATFNDVNPQDQGDIDTVANSGLVRASNAVTVKTKAVHPFVVGDQVQVSPPSDGSAHDTSFDGVFPVATVPDSTHLTYAQTGANATSGNGYCGTPESRFAQRATQADHLRFQKAIGQRGLNLNALYRRLPLNIVLGNNTMERALRILNFLKNRNLGTDADPYNAPWKCKITAFLDAVDSSNRSLIEQLCGDIVTIDSTISEEFQGDYELVKKTIRLPSDVTSSGNSSSSGSSSAGPGVPAIELEMLQYLASAFSDSSTPQQSIASSPSRGVTPAVDANGQLLGTFHNNLVNANGTYTGANPLTQSGTTPTIIIASFTIQYGDGQISYNSGSVNPGSLGTWYVYCDDPTFAGGAVTYFASSTPLPLTAGNGRLYIGKITTISGGGGGGTGGGGGGGSCFSGNTRVRTVDGAVAFEEMPARVQIETKRGPRWARVESRHYEGWMHEMGNGELVTPPHLFGVTETSWIAACELWPDRMLFEGTVYTLHVETERDDERHLILENGAVAHNYSPF